MFYSFPLSPKTRANSTPSDQKRNHFFGLHVERRKGFVVPFVMLQKMGSPNKKDAE